MACHRQARTAVVSAGGSHLGQWGPKSCWPPAPRSAGIRSAMFLDIFTLWTVEETHQVSPGLCSIQVASYGPDTWSNEAGLTGINYKAANRGGLGAALY